MRHTQLLTHTPEVQNCHCVVLGRGVRGGRGVMGAGVHVLQKTKSFPEHSFECFKDTREYSSVALAT